MTAESTRPHALAHLRQSGKITGLADTEELARDAFWDVDCDVLIPAALEKQITEPTPDGFRPN